MRTNRHCASDCDCSVVRSDMDRRTRASAARVLREVRRRRRSREFARDDDDDDRGGDGVFLAMRGTKRRGKKIELITHRRVGATGTSGDGETDGEVYATATIGWGELWAR